LFCQNIFEKNSASELGGGIHSSTRDFQLNQTQFMENTAFRGAALSYDKCMQHNSFNILFERNVGLETNGDIFYDSNTPENASMCPTNNSWCINCMYKNNTSPTGAPTQSPVIYAPFTVDELDVNSLITSQMAPVVYIIPVLIGCIALCGCIDARMGGSVDYQVCHFKGIYNIKYWFVCWLVEIHFANSFLYFGFTI